MALHSSSINLHDFQQIMATSEVHLCTAPFWSDVDNRKAGQIRYQVYDAINEDARPALKHVSMHISEVLADTNKAG